jgi:hypothetical protein
MIYARRIAAGLADEAAGNDPHVPEFCHNYIRYLIFLDFFGFSKKLG